MAKLFNKQSSPKVFNRPRTIDGNAVLADIRKARQSTPRGYGMIRNNKTGEVVERYGNVPAPQAPQAPQVAPQVPQGRLPSMPTDEQRAYAADMMEVDPDFRGYSQAYERDRGFMPSYESYEQDKEDRTGEDQMAEYAVDYRQTLDSMMTIAEQKGLTFDDIANQIPEDIADNVIQMLKDPTKMKTDDDVIDVGIAIDTVADMLNLDTHKLFGEGIAEECGAECLQRREDAVIKNRDKILDNGYTEEEYQETLEKLRRQKEEL